VKRNRQRSVNREVRFDEVKYDEIVRNEHSLKLPVHRVPLTGTVEVPVSAQKQMKSDTWAYWRQ